MTEFLQRCRVLETRSATLYRLLQSHENLQPTTQELFARLEAQEARHADRLDAALHSVARPLNAFPAGGTFPELLAKRTEALLVTLEGRQVSPCEAVRLLQGLELRYWDFHLQNALSFQEEPFMSLFIELAREEKSHISLLNEHFLELANASGAVPAL